MKSSIFAAASLLAVAAVAQPHGHAHKHIKKAEAPMVIVTEMVSTTTTIGVTTTIWVTEGQEPASSVGPASSVQPVVSSAAPVVSSAAPVVSSAAPVASSKAQGAQFFEPSSKASSAPIVSTTPVSVAPVVPTTSAAPIPTTSTPEPVSVQSEAPQVQSVAPVVVPSSTIAPVVQAPTTSAAPAPVSSSSSGSSSSGSSSGSGSGGAALYGKCGKGSPCTGSTSYYDIDGLTACGTQPDGTTEPVVAMSSLLMGPISNNNPYCDKTITVTYKGASVVARIVDKCPSCGIEGLDLSHAAFKALSSDYTTIGRTDTSWYFN